MDVDRVKLYYNIAGAILGALSGYVYWYYFGCENGCTIQAVWWRMTLYGLVLGYFTTSMLTDYVFSNKSK